jgi:hypothetical protein
MKKIVGLLFAILALTSVASAAPDTVKIFLWDNDAGEAAQEAPASVMDQNYNSYYVWSDIRDGNWNIYGRIWERAPQAATGAFLVNEIRMDNHVQRYPDVAGTTGDFFFTVWQDSLLKNGELWQVYGRKFDKSGLPMTGDFLVSEVVKGNAKFPRIAVNARTQDFVVVWQDDRDGQFDVWARLFDYKCNPKSNDIKINEDGLKVGHIQPVVSFTEAGIAIAWQDNRDGIAKADIYLRYFKPDLSPMTSSVMVNDDVETRHFTPAIAASDTGFFTIVWLNFSKSANGDIFAQRYDPDAKKINQNLAISNTTVTTEANRIPSVTMGIDRNSFWTSWADSSSSTNKYQIRARYFDQYERLGATIKVVNENYANGQRAPDVCRFGDWFSVAWLDSSRANGKGDIFGQYFLLDQKDDTLDGQGINYNISKDRAAGRKIWYHPKKDYDNPATSGWNEDPIAEPESLYVPLDSAYVLALNERNIPNQLFFQITNTDTMEYMWRKQGKINSKQYDMCLLNLGYAEDGSSAGTMEAEQQDSLIQFALSDSKCLLATGNDFGEMYNADSIFTFFGSKYVGPGNPAATGNIQKIEGLPGTFTEGMYFEYPYQQGPDNSVDIIDQMMSGSQLIMGSDPASKWSRGRGTSYGSFYKESKASNHQNVYLTFSIGSLSNGIHPSTASELTRRILAYQGFNVEPEPIVDLVDSVYTSTIEGSVELSWTAVSDDNLAEAASKYWLKYSKYNASASDLGKMSSEVDFIDTGFTYFQNTWAAPLTPKSLEKKIIYGFAPGDTLIFALKAGDESSPTRWGTLGNEPKIVVYGDTVTPHTVRLGYTYGCVNDFTKSERIDIRLGDTLFTTWDASSLYLGYSRNDWRTAGDLVFYFDTRTGGADSTVKYNGTLAAGFDANFHPDFCLVFESGDSVFLKVWDSVKKAWADSIKNPAYPISYRSLDSVNKYTYAEIQIPFTYLKYTVGNVFKFLAVCQNETNDNSWNAFPVTNNVGKGAKVPAKYPYFYQFNSLTSGLSPRAAAQPLAIELSEFACQSGSDGITLTWQTASEDNNYEWLIERSPSPAEDFQNIATVKAEAGSPAGRQYTYIDASVLSNTTYYYRLGDKDNSGQITWHGPVMALSSGPVYEKLQLMPCRPNPASGAVSISYTLPKTGTVSLNVYDICGRRVNLLEQGQKQSGVYNLTWKGDDSQGRLLPAGVYFYQLNFEGTSLTQRMVLLR